MRPNEKKLQYEHIVQICNSSHKDKSNPYFLIGRRFDKKYIYIVKEKEAEAPANFDNSFFQILPADNENLKSTHDKTVRFGDEVLFKHINSSKYLAVALEYTESKKGSFKFLLATKNSRSTERCVFQILPSRSFQKTADPVKFDFNVYLFSPRNAIYVSTEDCTQSIGTFKNIPQEYVSQRKRLVGIHQKQMRWYFKFYDDHLNTENDTIRDKDLIYLVNSKSNGLLTVKKEISHHHGKSNQYNSLNESQMDANNISGVSNFQFIVKDIIPSYISYPIKNEPKIFNCFWQVSLRNNDGRQDMTFTHLTEEYSLPSNMFTTLVGQGLDQNPDRLVRSGEFLQLGRRIHDINQWLGDQKNEKARMTKSIPRKVVGSTDKISSAYLIKYLDFLEDQSKGDILVFKIAKVPLKLKRVLYELIQAKEKIEQFNGLIRRNTQSLDQLVSVTEMGTKYRQTLDILNHIKAQLNKSSEDPLQQQQILQSQMILSDIGFIDVIVECLQAFYRSPQKIEDSTKEAKQNIKKLFDNLHELLQMACRDNPHIKQRMSRRHIHDLLRFAQQHTLSELNYDDTDTIREILSNNQHRAHNIISSQELKKMLAIKISKPMNIEGSLKFIRVLRLMCKNSPDAIASHQKIIVQHFLQKQQHTQSMEEEVYVSTTYKLQMKAQRNMMRITPRINKGDLVFFTFSLQWKNILEMCIEYTNQENSPNNRNRDTWRWFIEWIELLADVCQTKNIYGKAFAESVFSPKMFEYFVTIERNHKVTPNDFEDEHIGEALDKTKLYFHKHIIRLINNVWVETIYNMPRRTDLIYLVDNETYLAYKAMHPANNNMKGNPKSLMIQLKEFIKVYLDSIDGNYLIQREGESIEEKEPTRSDSSFNESFRNVMKLMKNLLVYGFLQEDTPEETIESQRYYLRVLHQVFDIQKLYRDSIKFMKPAIEIIQILVEMDLQDCRNQILSGLYESYKDAPKIQPDIQTLSAQGKLNFKWKRFDLELVRNIRQSILKLILYPVGYNYEFFLLCKRLFERFMQMQRILIEQLQNITIIEPTTEDLDMMENLYRIRQVFEVFEIRELNGVTLANQHELNTPVWDTQNECLIGFLIYLINIMKNNHDEYLLREYKDRLYLYECLSRPDYIVPPYLETEEPNRRNQKLIKEMGIHRQLFRYLMEFSIEDADPLARKLVYLAYQFLAVFAWRNKENKIELAPLSQKMLEHAQHIWGAIDALKEYYTDNETLILDAERVSSVTEKVTEYIFGKIILGEEFEGRGESKYQTFYASKLIDFLISLIETNHIRLDENSIVVLSFILDKDRLQITKPQLASDLRKLDEQIKRYEMQFNSLQPLKQPQKHETEAVLHMSPQLTYLSVLFGLLGKLVGQNEINMAKCKKLHHPDTLATILQRSKRCWPLKAATRHYLNKLYYSRMEANSYYDIIMGLEIQTIIEDLNEYIYARERYCWNARFRLCNSMRCIFLSSSLHMNIQRIIQTLLLITKDKNMMSKIVNMDLKSAGSADPASQNTVQVICKFMRLYERLRLIKINYFTSCIPMKNKIAQVLLALETHIFLIDFEHNKFNTKYQKNFDYRELYKQLARKSGDMNDYDELSLCCRALSNTELLMFFQNDEDYKTYAQGIPTIKKEPEKQPGSALTPFIRRNILSITDNIVEEEPQIDSAMTLGGDDDDRAVQEYKPVLSFLDRNLARMEPQTIIDIRFRTKSSVRNIIQTILSRPKENLDDKPIPFTSYYNQFLKDLFHQSEQAMMNPEKLEYEELEAMVNTINRINDTIFTHSQAFDVSVLAFHLRIYGYNFRALFDSGKQMDFLKDLNLSFSRLIFKTYSLCNLHENLEITYEFSKFVVTYFRCSNNSQKVLYDLIHDDPKSQFLVALDNNIAQLCQEIVKSLDSSLANKDGLNRQGIFCHRRKYFVIQDVKETSFGQTIRISRIIQSFKNTFIFMQLLCQNNFVLFKKQFREQRTSDNRIKLRNRNLLLRSTIQLRRLLGVYCITIKDLPEKILDFINEIAQIPCYENQIELAKSTFFQDICQFLKDMNTKSTGTRQQQFNDVYPYLVIIIERFLKIIVSLLESNIDDIYDSFINKLNVNFFDIVLKMVNWPQEDESMEKCKQIKIHMLLIYKQLETKIGKKTVPLLQSMKNFIDKKDQDDPTFKLKDCIESIEVSLEGNEHKLYFFKPEEAKDISEDDEFLEDLEYQLNRDTQLQKLGSLLQNLKNLQIYMVHRHYIRTEVPYVGKLMQLNRPATIVSLLINLILVYGTFIHIHTGIGHDEIRSQYLLPLQLIQFVLGSLYCLATLYSQVIHKAIVKYNESGKIDNGKRTQARLAKLELSDYRDMIQEKLSVIIYLIICFCGLFSSPYYYSIHLFYLFSKISVLQNVYEALVKNSLQLFYLALMGVGFFVVFSIMTLETYAPFADQKYCHNILQCFVVIYNKQVFIDSDQANQPSFKSLWYEILYSVFFGSLFGNVISGLMTDTFAELRDEKDSIENDENNLCYICGFTRYEIEKQNKDGLKLRKIFNAHKIKHNKWSYLYYVFELKKKDEKEYTGLEYIISEKVKKNSTTWFPVKPEQEVKIEELINDLRKVDEL